jgi:hypothetical protein
VEEGKLQWIADSFQVTIAYPPEERKLLSELTNWELLNLPKHEILSMADNLHDQYGISPEFLSDALHPYLVQSAGMARLMQRFNITIEKPLLYFVSATKHYSWPKSAGEPVFSNCLPPSLIMFSL